MKIDVHCHMIPVSVIDYVLGKPDVFGVTSEYRGEREFLAHREGIAYPKMASFFDLNVIRESIHSKGLDKALLSIAPPFSFYGLEQKAATQIARTINDEVFQICRQYPDDFIGVAHVPLAYIDESCRELKRAAEKLGMVGVQIGASLGDSELDLLALTPFFRLAEALNLPVIIHPFRYKASVSVQSEYYLFNLLGNPIDTTTTASHIIFSGILDRFPNLKIVLAHGAGFLPYQIGRLDRGYLVRPEARKYARKTPSSYLKNFYCDTITFSPAALSFAIEKMGADHVMLGTDYPFDMGDDDPVALIKSATLEKTVEQDIFGNNACRLFSITGSK